LRYWRGVLATGLLVASVLAVDGGVPAEAPFAQDEAAAADALRRCNERVADATKVERTDSDSAMRLADEALHWGAPARDQLAALLMVNPDLPKRIGAERVARLRSLAAQLTECVRSADFVMVEVTRAIQQRSPDSESARESAAASFNEYILRYPKHASTQTVKGWLDRLEKHPAK
jgi:hypothetical protein